MALAIALAIHVLGVVVWIGGVSLVTTVLLPAARAIEARSPGTGLAWFEAVEHRFGSQARWVVAMTGLSGLYMLYQLDLWGSMGSASLWWVDAMVIVWLIFAAMLYVVEPFVIRRFVASHSERSPADRLRVMQLLHSILLVLSLITVLGAVLGSHGVSFG